MLVVLVLSGGGGLKGGVKRQGGGHGRLNLDGGVNKVVLNKYNIKYLTLHILSYIKIQLSFY